MDVDSFISRPMVNLEWETMYSYSKVSGFAGTSLKLGIDITADYQPYTCTCTFCIIEFI